MCRRPAVSASTRSFFLAAARCTASKTMALGSAPSAPRTISAPVRSAHMASWSAAAARKVSPAASSTVCPAADWRRASLPMVVVLPTPFTPTNSQTSGWSARPSKRNARDPTDSSSWRIDAPRASSRSSPPLISLDCTLARSSSSRTPVVADTDVGPDQRLLQRLPCGLVDSARTQRGHRSAEETAHAAETAPIRGGCSRRLDRGLGRRLRFRRRGAHRCGSRFGRCRRRPGEAGVGGAGGARVAPPARRRERERAIAAEGDRQDDHRDDDDDRVPITAGAPRARRRRAAASAAAFCAAATAAASSAYVVSSSPAVLVFVGPRRPAGPRPRRSRRPRRR